MFRRATLVRDNLTTEPWQHKLACRVIGQAFKDLSSNGIRRDDRVSAREFLAGSAMLRYWCHVGGLDLRWIVTRAGSDRLPRDA